MLKALRKAITSQAKDSEVYQKNGNFFFYIKTPSNISIWTLIHGTLIRAMKDDSEIFNYGIAMLLTMNGIAIASAVETAEKEGFIEVPLPPETKWCSCLQHYLLDGGRSVGFSYSLKNEETKKATS